MQEAWGEYRPEREILGNLRQQVAISGSQRVRLRRGPVESVLNCSLSGRGLLLIELLKVGRADVSRARGPKRKIRNRSEGRSDFPCGYVAGCTVMGEPHSAVEIELVCPQGHERFECSFAYGIASDGRREIARKPVLRGS